MSSHIKAKQTFTCDECGYICENKIDLSNHIIAHSSVKNTVVRNINSFPHVGDLYYSMKKTMALVKIFINAMIVMLYIFKSSYTYFL